MKILYIAPYMTCNTIPLLSQCKAGFGYMVYDIASSVAMKETVDALLYNYRYKSFDSNNIHFIESSFGLFFKYFFHVCSPLIPFKLWWKYKMKTRTLVRIIYGWLLSGYYKSVIEKGNYDVVHIHGCAFMNEYLISICEELKQPFMFTFHGLNSFSDSVKLEPAGKRFEKDFLKRVIESKLNLSVIASGIKKTIQNYFGYENINNIRVINNAFFIANLADNYREDIREKYQIPQKAKILLYVGNISSNKNQEQMVRAYELLDKQLALNTYILFLGRNNEPGYNIDKLVTKSSYPNHLLLCGNIDKEAISYYYRQADAVALLSKTEGFGLSLIEGMHFGLPCMMFKDLDAFEDIYDERAVIAIPNRQDQMVSRCMEELLARSWDKTYIMEYSRKFEPQSMVDNYINMYKQIK